MFLSSSASANGRFVKVCGVCNTADALLCAQLGVDAVGMILTNQGSIRKPGSDRLTRTEAAKLVQTLPDQLKSVLLVHAEDLNEIFELTDEIRPSALQVQRCVAPKTLLCVKKRFPEQFIIKSFSVRSGISLPELEEEIRTYLDHGAIDAVLLDGARGGSGVTHDWNISAELVKRLSNTRVILAGGLKAENIAEALRIVRPFGVDVMSGVTCAEHRDRKDPNRLGAFIKAMQKD